MTMMFVWPMMVQAQVVLDDDEDEEEVVEEVEDDDEEDGRTAAENPTFDREVFIERLRRLPTIMELPYNDVVKQFIERYSGRLRYSVSYMLGACNFYMPIFEEALEAYGLPLELKYLPVIESALNPKAVSRVGATGLWQFMLTTATGAWSSPPTTAARATSTRPSIGHRLPARTRRSTSRTTGTSTPTCRRRPEATCRPSLLPTTS